MWGAVHNKSQNFRHLHGQAGVKQEVDGFIPPRILLSNEEGQPGSLPQDIGADGGLAHGRKAWPDWPVSFSLEVVAGHSEDIAFLNPLWPGRCGLVCQCSPGSWRGGTPSSTSLPFSGEEETAASLRASRTPPLVSPKLLKNGMDFLYLLGHTVPTWQVHPSPRLRLRATMEL